MNKKGFTLIELSIVLVIIGLLVSGILIGQSLIESAQISSTISQLQQYDSAVDQFKSKYKSLPGDSRYFGGNGNGVIGRTPATDPNRTDINSYGGEMPNFWHHLFLDKYPAASWLPGATYIPSKTNAPIAKVGANGTAIIPSAIGTGSFNADTANPRNYYILLSPNNVLTTPIYLFTTATDGNRALKPAQLLAIDNKIDDAVANTGNVIAGRIASTGAGIIATQNTSCSDVSGVYDLSKDSYECTPLIRMGVCFGGTKVMKNGFTLVELSIVLVIIGLLIGGILVGQSMIESAKLNRLVSDLRQYEVAVTQFYAKFKQYPGESSYFDPPGTPDKILNYGDEDNDGNDDGLGCKNGGPNANVEYVQAWAHLSQSAMLKKTYQPWAPDNCGGSHASDYMDESLVGIIQPYTEVNQNATPYTILSKPPISFLKEYSYSNLSFSFNLNPLVAGALDKKMDAQNFDSTSKQIGLVNRFDSGNCYTGSVAVVCGDSQAIYGTFLYYINP